MKALKQPGVFDATAVQSDVSFLFPQFIDSFRFLFFSLFSFLFLLFLLYGRLISSFIRVVYQHGPNHLSRCRKLALGLDMWQG